VKETAGLTYALAQLVYCEMTHLENSRRQRLPRSLLLAVLGFGLLCFPGARKPRDADAHPATTSQPAEAQPVIFVPYAVNLSSPAHHPHPPPFRPTPTPITALPPTNVYANCQVHKDLDYLEDLTTDRTVVSTYDSDSRLVLEETDMNADGTVDVVRRRTYNANGDLLTASADADNDGREDSVSEIDYDVYGRAVAERHDNNGDGAYDAQTRYVYGRRGYLRCELLDFDSDGHWDQMLRHEYNPDGKKVVTQSVDGIDFSVKRVTTYEYDGDLLTRFTVYEGDSDLAPRVGVLTYDDQGRIVAEAYIDDGKADPVRGFKYGSAGLVVERVAYRGGTRHDWVYFEYDNVGRLVRERQRSVASAPSVAHYTTICR